MALLKELKVTIDKITIENPDTKTYRLKFNNKEKFDFKAGQYIIIKHQKDGKPLIRQYSIASSPSEKGYIEIVLNKVPDGYFSTYMHDIIKVGDELEIKGPMGIFILKEPIENDLVFIATGTGVGPLRAMIKKAFELKTNKKVWLFFGERTEEDILYRKEFEELEKKHKNFRFIPTLSRQEWKGEKGYVQEAVRKYIKNTKNKEAYICGLIKMVDETRNLLKGIGFDPKNIHFEKYN